MRETVEYNSILTARAFTDTDKFQRAQHARVLCDASEKWIGSISDEGLYDLFGNEIAVYRSEETREDENGKTRIVEYASGVATYRLEGDALLDGHGRFLGRIWRRPLNVPRIVVLSALAALLIAAIILIALTGMPTPIVIGKPEEPDIRPIIDVRDDVGAWDAQETVGVFGDSVQPGSSGEYGFILNNPHGTEIAYEFYLEPQYEGNAVPVFPILFRLRMNNVLVQTETWQTIDKLRLENMAILPESSQSFTLEWEWPFEGSSDENDTLIGADGGKISIVLHLSAVQSR